MYLRYTAWLALAGTSWTAAQNASTSGLPYNTTYNPSNATIFQLSDDSDFAFFLETQLTVVKTEAASSGEILEMATMIDPNSIESVYDAFYPFAEKIHALAESIDPTIDPVGARESYFRASNYYRSSVFFLVGNASDPRLYNVWPKMLDCFAKAINLMEPAPGVPVTLHAANSSIGAFQIPAYFFKGSSATTDKLPTIIVGTGYDGAQQDIFHLECGEILKRGFNCISYEGPGQPTVRRTQFLPFIPDWYNVVTPVVDYLFTRSDVDTDKIVLFGDSYGGQLAPIAASQEPRLSAVILLDGMQSLRHALVEQFPSYLVALYNHNKTAEFNEAVDQIINDPHLPMGFRVILAYTLWAFNTTNAAQAWGELGATAWGREVASTIHVPVFVAKGQDDTITLNESNIARHLLETARPNGKNLTYFYDFQTSYGAGEHTSIGAESLVWVVIFKWLSGIWGGYKYSKNA